jgi:hypothetical protein
MDLFAQQVKENPKATIGMMFAQAVVLVFMR